MSSRLLLLLSLVVLLVSGGLIFAQQTPRAPQAPPAPMTAAPAAPSAPDAPIPPPEGMENFTFFKIGGNFLGILPEEVDKENMNRLGLREVRGVAVNIVAEGSPAERAGLKKDDVILRFDNEPVTTVRKLYRLVEEATAGQTVRLTISRGGAEQEVSVTLGKRDGGGGMAPHVFRVTPRAGGEWNAPVVPGQPKSFMYSFGARRRIGLSMMPLTKQLADYFGVAGGRGLLVMSVNQDGPAAKAGMKAGDVITMVDGKDVEGAFNLLRALGNKDQTELNLTIIRDKAQQTIKVTPEHMNDAPSSFSPEMGFPPEVGELALPEMNLPPMPQMDVLMPRVEMNLQNFNLPALKMNQMVLPPMEVNPKIKSVRPLPPIML